MYDTEVVVIGKLRLTSRETPEIGSEGTSEWVYVEKISSGPTVARVCASDPPYWEGRAGERFDLEAAPTWAHIQSRSAQS